ncbi:Translation initiation factor IF-2 [Sporomusa sphaeroides DSM 2875]|uniref:Translation initiation factor IF-2 n=2 Tax=Sporomusa TaxID=2375 RepID=A0ABM9VXP2_9FIRM|nr:translation initiation factor IF-2 [Sporomusa sphaeroides]OLS58206.1 translation initiation factor IF-2 [Sporomusa sphaeroides DSM 2875]CVK17607.1 Translation initiation factor IF-2 [Sporomusa sphaeroides DSM 2875]
MSKYRVYELAKEYNTTSKVIIDILGRHNITAKNHMSSVDEDAKVAIDRTFARKTGEPNPGTPVRTAQSSQPAAPAEQRVSQPAAANAVPAAHSHQPSNRPNQSGQQQNRPVRSNQSQSRPGVNSQQPQNRPGTNSQQPQNRPGTNSQQQQNRPGYNNQQQQNRPGYNNQQQQNRPGFNNQQQQNRPGFSNQQQQNRPGYNNQQQQNRPGTNNQQQQNRPGFNNQQQRPPQRPQTPMQQSGQQRQQPNPASGADNRPQGQQNSQFQNNNRRSTNNNSRRGPGQGNRNSQQRSGQHRNQAGRNQFTPPKAEMPKPKSIKIGESITVKDLAGKMGREAGEVIKKLMMLGTMVSINQEVDFDTATILGGEFGVTVEAIPPEEDPTEIPEIEDDEKDLVHRPPVVTVMGHVDHGKTSLLDSIRQTHVTSQEAGGITQHIGAYQVMCQGKKIVFLDTPGHEAFTSMRARGAQVTDIAILVVAADDGVMPQTIEAINHAKSAKVPIIVAINKIDRPGANPDRVKQQLAEHQLIPEDWGGDTIMVPVSAHQKTGISDILEMILLVAEMLDLKANPNRLAYGTIIEAKLDKGRGPVSTVLVQKGTLRIGDTIIAGTAYGKVRAMTNDRGEKIKKAEPSTPVEVLGLADVPQAGDILVAVDERTARAVAEKRVAKKRTEDIKQSQKVSLDDLFKQIQEGSLKDLNIVVKADVQGSIEALRQSLVNIKNNEVRVNIVHAGVGAINESDVMLAAASNALIIGFNVRPDGNARKAADTEKIDVRTYRVIYEAINDVEAAITGMLAPEFKEVVLGHVEVRQVISIPKAVVAGSYVTEGKITSTSQVRILRNGIVIHEGKLESLRRFKDDVKEVAQGYECGITVEKFRDIKEGDIIEAFTMEEVAPRA